MIYLNGNKGDKKKHDIGNIYRFAEFNAGHSERQRTIQY